VLNNPVNFRDPSGLDAFVYEVPIEGPLVDNHRNFDRCSSIG